MSFSLIRFFTIIIFIIQLFLCFVGKQEWQRILPLSMAVGFEMLCWAAFFVGRVIGMEATISFPAFILGYVGLYWTGAPIVAWAVYAIVKFVQNKRK